MPSQILGFFNKPGRANVVEIIAEIGVNHNGSVAAAKELVHACADAGVDTVKFQVFRAEEIVSRHSVAAEYQIANTGLQSQFELVRSLELDFDAFFELKELAQGLGIGFLATPDGYESLEFLRDRLGLRRIKVGSGEVTNEHFLKAVSESADEVLMSTGMSTLDEVIRAVGWITEQGQNSPRLELLHCVSAYPAPFATINLKAIETLGNATGLSVGFSDHTQGSLASCLAVGLGAHIIEKHVTMDSALSGPDHLASVSVMDLGAFVRSVRNSALALGDGLKRPTLEEQANLPVVRRRVVASRVIEKHEEINLEAITFLRSDNGAYAENWRNIVGRRAVNRIGHGLGIGLDDVE